MYCKSTYCKNYVNIPPRGTLLRILKYKRSNDKMNKQRFIEGYSWFFWSVQIVILWTSSISSWCWECWWPVFSVNLSDFSSYSLGGAVASWLCPPKGPWGLWADGLSSSLVSLSLINDCCRVRGCWGSESFGALRLMHIVDRLMSCLQILKRQNIHINTQNNVQPKLTKTVQ